MKKIKILQLVIVSAILFFIAGCEKDKITSPFSAKTENNAKLLLFLEEEGDIINKIPLPMIEPYDVYNNLSNCLVIDLRDNPDYLKGHIGGAKNILKDSLFNYVKVNYLKFNKVVLVSASGQSAAYFSSLLHLAGFSNIYYMNYGMASWNMFFSAVWTDRIGKSEGAVFSNTFYPKNGYSPLPEINLNSSGESMEDFVQTRISNLIKEGFNEDYSSVYSKSTMIFSYWIDNKTQFYTVCVGPIMLYSSNPYTTNTYHPVGAVFYQIPPLPSDFRSVNYLQTLPSNGSIAIYSGTGQESAFYIAYLRLLGYDAKSILFGMNNIDYYMLSHSPEISPYAFNNSYIMNYPYFTESNGK
ncbi:MAG: rhodanese-like domain-containing protein [Ignavibacteriaceae bacterium]|jgi:rhodanese-related sulfurtransferase